MSAEGLEKLEHLAADLQRWSEDLTNGGEIDVKAELTLNAIPFMLGIVKATYEELSEQGGVLVEMVESEMEDHTELAAMIVTVIETGRAICRTIKQNNYKLDNDIISGQLKKAIEDYDHNAVVTLNRVREVLVEEWEDDPEAQDQSSDDDSEETSEQTENETEAEETEIPDQPQEEVKDA